MIGIMEGHFHRNQFAQSQTRTRQCPRQGKAECVSGPLSTAFTESNLFGLICLIPDEIGSYSHKYNECGPYVDLRLKSHD